MSCGTAGSVTRTRQDTTPVSGVATDAVRGAGSVTEVPLILLRPRRTTWPTNQRPPDDAAVRAASWGALWLRNGAPVDRLRRRTVARPGCRTAAGCCRPTGRRHSRRPGERVRLRTRQESYWLRSEPPGRHQALQAGAHLRYSPERCLPAARRILTLAIHGAHAKQGSLLVPSGEISTLNPIGASMAWWSRETAD